MGKCNLYLIACTLLTSCVSSEPVRQESKPIDLSKYSDVQLCKTKNHYENSLLNVNPSSHPEYSENKNRYKILLKEIQLRNKNKVVAFCDKVINDDLESTLTPEQKAKLELTPKQKQKRTFYLCQALGEQCP